MARLEGKKLLAKAKRSFEKLHRWEPMLRACYNAAMPLRNPYAVSSDGSPQGVKTASSQAKNVLYDSTLAYNAQRLANHIKSELMPSEQEWVTFAPGVLVPDSQKKQATADLQTIQKQAFAALQISNFDSAVGEWLLELIVTGTGCMLKLNGGDEMPVAWATVTQGQVGLEESPLGYIDFITRKYYMTVEEVEKLWRDAKLSEALQKIKDDDKEGTQYVNLIDVCYYDQKDEKWYYDVIFIDTTASSTQEPDVIVKRTYNTAQWVIARWSKMAGQERGRGPVEMALPDHMTLNRIKELLLKNASLGVSGVWMTKDAAFFNANNLTIKPGAIIPVRSTGGPNGASLARLDVGGDLQLAQLVIEDLINSIQRIMLNNSLPDEVGPVRSATEIMARLRQLQQELGTPFTRILYEGVSQIMQIVVSDLVDRGVIQVPQAKALKFNRGVVKLQFTSPLAQSQRMREVETLIQAVQMTAGMLPEMAAQLVPLSFKVEDIGSWIAEKLGVDAKLVRDEGDRSNLQGMAGQLIAANNGGGVGPGAVPGVGGAASGGGDAANPLQLAA